MKWLTRLAFTLMVAANVLMMVPTFTPAGAQSPTPPSGDGGPIWPHDPDHADRAASWCVVHFGRREIDEAFSDCNYAVAVNPRNAVAYSNRGSLYLSLGDLAKALADFEKAIELAPDTAVVHYNRGLVRAELGNRDGAISDYTEAIRLNPDLAIAFHNRGFEYETRGDRPKALSDYGRALAIDPKLEPPSRGIARLRGDL